MRLKLLVFALVASLAAVSAALADPGKNHRHPATGPGCRPAVKVVLNGVLAADVDPQDGDDSFVLTVKHSNKHGRAYKQAGSATIMLDVKTRINRQGAHNLGGLAPNDRVSVKAKVCKADLKDGATPDLTARKIDAHPAPAEEPTGP
jgi:hypothetical protein